ncbi:MAG: metallophosphoesterase N-terminal domain-containing protein, partial [Rhodothermales bacterium]
MRPHTLRSLSRRAFLSRAGLASTALLVPGLTTGTLRRLRNGVVRVTGRVASGGRGVAGIRVSDGRQVALTDPDGAYELVADSSSQYVWISVPDGHRIPMSDSGTANFYS